MINSVFVDEALKPHKLIANHFPILKDDAALSDVSILQPNGVVTGSKDGVSVTDNTLMISKITSFLKLESTKASSLVALPEYCAPWEVIEKINERELLPNDGQLWIFGFQGITLDNLLEIEKRCKNIVFEYDRDLTTTKAFVGPVVHIFKATHETDGEKVVCLIQFKTHPMADAHQFEKDHLVLGKKFYIFRNPEDEIRLGTLICADSLNPLVTSKFNEIFKDWRDKAYWVIHLQLNTDPRNTSFKRYRDDELGGVRNTDRKAVLCLNWAQSTYISGNTPKIQDYGVSALYLKEKDLKVTSGMIDANHKRGAYYSYPETRAHALFFNFTEAVFHFSLAKLARNSVSGPAGTTQLPSIKNAYTWSHEWLLHREFDDLSNRLCPWRSPRHALLEPQPPSSPTMREYLMLRSTGNFDGTPDSPMNLKSFKMNSSESILRLTYQQDTTTGAESFREMIVGRFRKLLDIIHQKNPWPEMLNSFQIDGSLRIVDDMPFVNLRLIRENAEPMDIFVSYLGSQSEAQKKESISHLQSRYKAEFRKRVFLWQESAGQIISFSISNQKIDDPEDIELIDITGV